MEKIMKEEEKKVIENNYFSAILSGEEDPLAR